MRKFLTLSLFILFTGVVFGQLSSDFQLGWEKYDKEVNSPYFSKEVSKWIFYCGDPYLGIGNGGFTSFGAFIHLPTDSLVGQGGRQIQEVKVHIRQPEYISSAELRIYEEDGSGTTGSIIYSQEFTPNYDGNEWTSVFLTTPYIIDESQEIVIGYNFVATGGYPISCDAGPASPNGDLFLFGTTWYHLSPSLDFNWNIKVGIGDQPTNDAMMTDVDINNVISTGNTDISGTMMNLGTSQINSFDLNWQVDDGDVNTENINGLSINQSDTYSFMHGTQWDALFGEHILKVWVSNMNGIGDDETPSNDTIRKKIKVVYPVDIELSSINTPDYYYQGDIDITGTITNRGMDNINSFDVTYNIDGGAESTTYSVTGVDIAYSETFEFTHDVAYNFPADGTYSVTVTISNVNGGGETNTADNVLSKDLIINSNIIQRTSVLEQFTTEMCSYCPATLSIIEAHLDENPNFIMMCHHAGFYTDFLTIPESEGQTEFYNGGTFAPAGMVDRHYNGKDNDEYGGIDPGPVFNDGDAYGTSRIDERTAVPALASIILNETYNSSTGAVDITINGEFLVDLSHDLGISLWITEDSIFSNGQAGSGGNWTHRYAVRDAISERLGDAYTGTTNAGDTYSVNYSYVPDASWNKDQLYLVAMVGNMNDADVNDREILNAAQIKISDLPAGINEVNSKVLIYPNPASDNIILKNIDNADVKIFDLLGKLVLNKTDISKNELIDVSNLKEGTYFVKIRLDNKVEMKKIVISR